MNPRRQTPKGEPTASEWYVLKVVWQFRSCAARDVIERVTVEKDWSDSTVKTLLRRLVEKGHLKTKRVGNSFLYEPNRSPLRSLQTAADSLLDFAKEGTVGPLLAYMVQKSRLNDDELTELRSLLEDKEPSKSPKPKRSK